MFFELLWTCSGADTETDKIEGTKRFPLYFIFEMGALIKFIAFVEEN